MYNIYVNNLKVKYNMIYKLNEYVYFKKDKYIFKEVSILDSNYRKIIYCFVVINGDIVHCLLEGFESPAKEEEDEAIKNYLKHKRRLISFEYAKVIVNN